MPINPEKADVFFLLKSPSRPCPIASCNNIPGHPGPKTTSNCPAGAGIAFKLTMAILSASTTFGFQCSELVNCNNPCLPPPPELPLSRRPLCSTVTDMFNLAIGLTSRTNVPSGLNISTSCRLATKEADT